MSRCFENKNLNNISDLGQIIIMIGRTFLYELVPVYSKLRSAYECRDYIYNTMDSLFDEIMLLYNL